MCPPASRSSPFSRWPLSAPSVASCAGTCPDLLPSLPLSVRNDLPGLRAQFPPLGRFLGWCRGFLWALTDARQRSTGLLKSGNLCVDFCND
jgi:hypothetical protein